jgi:hypothetical protein
MERRERDLLIFAVGLLVGGGISVPLQFLLPITGMTPPVLLILGSLLALTAVLLSTSSRE